MFANKATRGQTDNLWTDSTDGLLCDNTSAKHISDIMKAGEEDYS